MPVENSNKLFHLFKEKIDKAFGEVAGVGASTVESEGSVVKCLDEEQRMALFVVLEPQEGDETTDLHGDTYTADDIFKARKSYREHCNKANLFHQVELQGEAYPEQDFINLADFETEDGRVIKSGTWLQWWHFPEGNESSDLLWKAVLSGEITGVSIGAKASFVDIEKSLEKVPAVRRLTDIKFEHEGAHVALVGKHQGGAANGHTVLLTKATDKLPEVIDLGKSLEQVEVKMSMEEFLRKFFDMWHSEAEMLTKLLGFETEYEAYANDASLSEPKSHTDFLEDRLTGITLMKSMSEGTLESISKADYLNILKYQQTFENNGETMSQADMVKKSLLDESNQKVADLTKSVSDLQAELKKANEELHDLKAAEAANVEKARKDALAEVLPAEQVEVTYKSLASLDQESFDNIVKQFGGKLEAESESDDFVEKGAADSGEIEEDSLLKLAKSKFNK